LFDKLYESTSFVGAVVAETAAKKVKSEENVEAEEEEEEVADLEMTTSSDAAMSFTTSYDLSQGDDVVSSTSDVYTCDYEGC